MKRPTVPSVLQSSIEVYLKKKKKDYEMLTKKSSSSELTPSMLLDLLVHLNVVVPLGDGEKYFMPCAITHIHEINSSHSKESAILFHLC